METSPALKPSDWPEGSYLRDLFERAPLVLHLTYNDKITMTPAGYERLLGVKTYSDAVARLLMDRIITTVTLDQGKPTEHTVFVLLASPEQIQAITQGNAFCHPRLDRRINPIGPAWICGPIEQGMS
jgi:hypothetical protein